MPGVSGVSLILMGVPTTRTAGPTLGQDTDAALADIGYSAEEIAAFKVQGVV